jgi:hypothetical protein
MALNPHRRLHLNRIKAEAQRNINWVNTFPNRARLRAKAKGIRLVHYTTYLNRLIARIDNILLSEDWPAGLRAHQIHDRLEKEDMDIRNGLQE